MPSILNAPARIDDDGYVETHELTQEHSQPCKARPGFWRTLAHRITRRRTRRSHESHAPPCSTPRPFEAAMDQITRENPWISILALAAAL
jgi:hypothetical protein